MATNSEFNREVHFEIVEPIGVLATHSTGWSKELNLVKWNGGQPKYDIRDWSPDHAHMSRGVTLHEKEMRHIFELMRQRRQNERRRMPGNVHPGPPVQQQASGDAEASSVPAPPPAPSSAGEDDFNNMEISEDGEILQTSAEMEDI